MRNVKVKVPLTIALKKKKKKQCTSVQPSFPFFVNQLGALIHDT